MKAIILAALLIFAALPACAAVVDWLARVG